MRPHLEIKKKIQREEVLVAECAQTYTELWVQPQCCKEDEKGGMEKAWWRRWRQRRRLYGYPGKIIQTDQQ